MSVQDEIINQVKKVRQLQKMKMPAKAEEAQLDVMLQKYEAMNKASTN